MHSRIFAMEINVYKLIGFTVKSCFLFDTGGLPYLTGGKINYLRTRTFIAFLID